jgi:hypothetical protein
VFGCFCSLSCAKAFLLENVAFDAATQLILLERMACEIYGVTDVVASPPRLTLDVYGGPYSIERFRNVATRCTAKLVGEPYVSTYMVVEERSLVSSRVSALGVNGIGSVHGLRRPAHPVCVVAKETPKTSPYNDFLYKKGVVVTRADAQEAAQTVMRPGPSTDAQAQPNAITSAASHGAPLGALPVVPEVPEEDSTVKRSLRKKGGTLARFIKST